MADDLDSVFMARAIALSENGLYNTTPNPSVGCVFVRNGAIIGEGWTQPAGQDHAEKNALKAVLANGGDPRGSTAYVTLEPCSHFGRTAPCADALINAGVARVVVALQDPNPLVAGQGIERLRAAGVEVKLGVLREAASESICGFLKRMRTGLPWVRAKVAMSLDAGTALASGESQWITHAAARRDGHHWRARACAILTGSGTVLADDPLLNVREVATPRQPLRVVVDGQGRIPGTARLFQSGRTLLVHAGKAPRELPAGVETMALPRADTPERVDLAALIAELGRRHYNEIHVEGGASLTGAMITAGLVDELLLYVAPCLLGSGTIGMAALPQLSRLIERYRLTFHEVTRIGDDLRIRARFLAAGISS